MITGRLSSDSPSLTAKLKRLFTTAEISDLETEYQKSCESQLVLSENKLREEGVNFNPRPARILELLLEAGVSSKDKLQLALQSLTKAPQNLREEIPGVPVLSFPDLYWVLILDAIRHLNYETDPSRRYQELAQTVLELESQIHPVSETSARIKSKVDSALRLYRKFA